MANKRAKKPAAKPKPKDIKMKEVQEEMEEVTKKILTPV
jgi:hypothetical protein